ncbi:MAG: Flp pilus assembly complex ATPase component TadA [Endomicrobiales bacterium]|nr:Flp pilus assembly complex ATPase component TadA [Endomicrobiales bacterium]
MNTKILSIYQIKEGINQSVLAVNIAIALSKQIKEKVALADFSFNGENEIPLLLDSKPEKSILDLLPFLSQLDPNLLKGYIPAHPSGISVISGIEYKKKYLISPDHITKILQLLSSIYSYIIVTTPQEYDNQLTSLFDSSNLILLPVAPNLLSIHNIKSFLNNLKILHFPLNMIKPILSTKNSKSDIEKEKLQEYMDINIFYEIPNEQEIITASINSGKPSILSAPHSNFSREINKLAKTLSNDEIYEGITKRDNAIQSYSVKDLNQQEGLRYEMNYKVDAKYVQLKEKIHSELISKLDLKDIDIKNLFDKEKSGNVREKARKTIQDLLSKEASDLSREDRARFVEELLDEALGMGCLENFLKDPEITEIMVNGPNDIFVEKKGKIHYTGASFLSEKQLRTVIDRIVSPIGRRVDDASPLVDARLLDGSRVNVIIPPLSLIGPTITIRKFSKKKLVVEDLINFGALTPQMADFLKVCVQLRKNIVISGGTGSGKTTLLNVTSGFIPEDERIVTIEDSAELKLPQKHVISLESRPPSLEGTGEIPIRRLVINSLRMRPDRIVVGECRGGETLDMLQAMNTGHDGSLTTLHSNSPIDAVSRISTMAIMSGTELPDKAIKEQIASAVQIIVQLNRISDGSRKITEIAEIAGIKNNEITISSIFKFEQTGIKDGKVEGKFIATGNIPTFFDEIKIHGLTLDKNIFKKG